MTDTNHKEVLESVKCEKCGLECTTGAMAAFCSQGMQCVFWPHAEKPEDEGAELLIAQMWIKNACEQIGLQIDDRKRLNAEVDRLTRCFSEEQRRLDFLLDFLGDNEDVHDLPVRDWNDNADARRAIDERLAKMRPK